jgi:hypothetical protein
LFTCTSGTVDIYLYVVNTPIDKDIKNIKVIIILNIVLYLQRKRDMGFRQRKRRRKQGLYLT